MDSIPLRYLASREWMASAIDAGQAIQHRQQILQIDLEDLPAKLVKRVEAVADGFLLIQVRKKDRICVLDSGIDPELSFGPTKKELTPLDKPVIDSIGVLPELPSPTDDPLEVVEAWEAWIEEYKAKALAAIERLAADPPAAGRDEGFFVGPVRWDAVNISFGDGLSTQITLDTGAEAIRDARAGKLWNWATAQKFSSESLAAATEATDMAPVEVHNCFELMEPARLAALFLGQAKKRYQVAKAHHNARRMKVGDFDVEMTDWAKRRGSERLRLGIEDGYRMNSRYLDERIAAEAPGMYAMPASAATDGWATKANSPSEEALRLRRRIAAAMACNAPPNLDGQPKAEIVIVKNPPHQIYFADSGLMTENGLVGGDLPHRDGWPWAVNFDDEVVGSGPIPFEAVVVKHWLGRFHLIGAVAGQNGSGPPGIWAIPNINFYEDDGTVIAQDPDAPTPNAAKRKPPEPAKEDDIPF